MHAAAWEVAFADLAAAAAAAATKRTAALAAAAASSAADAAALGAALAACRRDLAAERRSAASLRGALHAAAVAVGPGGPSHWDADRRLAAAAAAAAAQQLRADALAGALEAANARRRHAAGRPRPREGRAPVRAPLHRTLTPPTTYAGDAVGSFLADLGHDRLLVLQQRGQDARPLWLK